MGQQYKISEPRALDDTRYEDALEKLVASLRRDLAVISRLIDSGDYLGAEAKAKITEGLNDIDGVLYRRAEING